MIELKKELAIPTRILDQLVDRCKNITDGYSIRYGYDNKSYATVFTVQGSYILTGSPFKVLAEVTALNTVEFKLYRDGVVTTELADFTDEGIEFNLFESGFLLSVSDLSTLVIGDTYDIRINNSTYSFKEVRAWKQATSDALHPYIEIYIGESLQSNNNAVDRRTATDTYDMRIEFDFSTVDTDDVARFISEIRNEIQDELQRDPRLHELTDEGNTCLAIDMQTTRAIPYVSESNGNLAGVILGVEVMYRTMLTNSRRTG